MKQNTYDVNQIRHCPTHKIELVPCIYTAFCPVCEKDLKQPTAVSKHYLTVQLTSKVEGKLRYRGPAGQRVFYKQENAQRKAKKIAASSKNFVAVIEVDAIAATYLNKNGTGDLSLNQSVQVIGEIVDVASP